MADIFFSYAHKDRERIAPLVTYLQEQGWSVWWDREIIPGKSYEQLIDDSIRAARCVVVAWSEAALASRWVHNEALEGFERDILVPLMLEDVRVPVAFRQTQAAKLGQWPHEFDPVELDYLLRGIREVLGETATVAAAAVAEPDVLAAPVPPPQEPAPASAQADARATASARPKPRWPWAMAAVIALAGIGWFAVDYQKERQAARDQAAALQDLTRLRQLADARENDEALLLAEHLTKVLGETAIEPELWTAFSAFHTVLSEPLGATVSIQPYDEPGAAWRTIGTTPIQNIRLARGVYRVRLELDGYAPAVHAQAVQPRPPGLVEIYEKLMGRSLPLPVQLQPARDTTEDMVFIPGGTFPVTMTGYRPGMVLDIADYFIGRHEVTNREFKRFIDAKGYQNDAYWQGLSFEDGDQRLTQAAALARFVDQSGRPGPANWQFGNFPEGEGDHPVTGVSWFEAIAYARFAGHELPTAFHWNRAAIGYDMSVQSAMVASSNFSGMLAPVGAYAGLSQFGLLDAAGNAREWVHNETKGMRAVLGGSAGDPKYMLVHNNERPALTRDATTGFRTMSRVDPTVDESHLDLAVITNRQINADFTPVPDGAYKVLQTQFEYRPMTADATLTTLAADHPRRRYQRVNLAYADGSEIPVYIMAPREQTSPLQPVLLFPGQTEFQYVKDSRATFLDPSFILTNIADSGRALVWPIYYGSNERYAGVWELSVEAQAVYYRDAVVKWRGEIGRVIDYLETRDDIDADKLAYLGISYGSSTASIAMTQEPRFKTAILALGGFLSLGRPPVAESWNFAARLKIPTLMINGRYDTIFPYEESQLPMFRTLGALPDQKRHLIYEGGHGPSGEQTSQVTLWMVDWLDRYLGRPDADPPSG